MLYCKCAVCVFLFFLCLLFFKKKFNFKVALTQFSSSYSPESHQRGQVSHFLHPQITKKCQAPAPVFTQVHFFQTTTLTGSPAYPDYCENSVWLYSDSLPLMLPTHITHLGSGSSEVNCSHTATVVMYDNSY